MADEAMPAGGPGVGQHMRLTGIKSNPALNGRMCTVAAYSSEKDRYTVELGVALAKQMQISVKEVCLVPAASADAEGLCALPNDALVRVLYLTADEKSLASASAACHLLRTSAREAAWQRAEALGYDDWEDEDLRLLAQCCPIRALHNQRAFLPSHIPATGATALRAVEEELARFKPLLVRPRRLLMPDEASDQPAGSPGSAEYANLAALYRSALADPAAARQPVSTTDIQRWHEGAWAEGLDGGSSEYFGGKIVGKTGEGAYIGASDVFVALMHRRFVPFIIEIDSKEGAGNALHEVVSAMLHRGHSTSPLVQTPAGQLVLEGPIVSQPIFLQEAGKSWLVIGVTTVADDDGNGSKALLCLDPWKPGKVVVTPAETFDNPSSTSQAQPAPATTSQYQVVICVGEGPVEADLAATILKLAGQEDSTPEAYHNAAAFKQGLWVLPRLTGGGLRDPIVHLSLALHAELRRREVKHFVKVPGGQHAGYNMF